MADYELQPLRQMQPCVTILLGREQPDMRCGGKRTRLPLARVATQEMATKLVEAIQMSEELDKSYESAWLETREDEVSVGTEVHTSLKAAAYAIVKKLVNKRAMTNEQSYTGSKVINLCELPAWTVPDELVVKTVRSLRR